MSQLRFERIEVYYAHIKVFRSASGENSHWLSKDLHEANTQRVSLSTLPTKQRAPPMEAECSLFKYPLKQLQTCRRCATCPYRNGKKNPLSETAQKQVCSTDGTLEIRMRE